MNQDKLEEELEQYLLASRSGTAQPMLLQRFKEPGVVEALIFVIKKHVKLFDPSVGVREEKSDTVIAAGCMTITSFLAQRTRLAHEEQITVEELNADQNYLAQH